MASFKAQRNLRRIELLETNQEEIKILSDKKDLILLEYIFLSSPERLFEFKKTD